MTSTDTTDTISIGELAKKFDITARAIRFYEEQGLLHPVRNGQQRIYLTFVCLMPEFLIAKYPIPFYLGGTSILIVVVVAMDTVTQVQTRLMSSQYESLIKKTNVK